MDEHSLAYECIQEVKRSNDRLEKSNKRWFIIAIIELVIIVGIVVGFFIYESQFEYVTTTTEQTQETEFVDSSNVTQTIN